MSGGAVTSVDNTVKLPPAIAERIPWEVLHRSYDEDTTLLAFSDVYFLANFLSASFADETVKFYSRVLRSAAGIRWRNIVNLPGVRARHVGNRRTKSKWEGINIYEIRGQTGYYVIPRPVATQPKAARRRGRPRAR